MVVSQSSVAESLFRGQSVIGQLSDQLGGGSVSGQSPVSYQLVACPKCHLAAAQWSACLVSPGLTGSTGIHTGWRTQASERSKGLSYTPSCSGLPCAQRNWVLLPVALGGIRSLGVLAVTVASEIGRGDRTGP